MPAKFGLRTGLRIHVRTFDGEHVLLDESSGDTHLLGPEIADALLRMAALQDARGFADYGGDLVDLGPGILSDREVVEALLRLNLIEPLAR